MKKELTLGAILVLALTSFTCHADYSNDTTNNTMGKSTETDLSDAAITAKIKTALAAEPGISSMNIHVTTVKGIVYLEGKVKNQAQVQKVIDLAKKENGTMNIDSSKLTVEP